MAFVYEDAAHLMRRMAFGGNPNEINQLVARGREGAVDYLINYDQINDTDFENLLDESFDLSDPRDGDKFNRGELTRWWTTLMMLGPRQFEEKMTLFWHNHFATSNSKVDDVLIYIQNRMLRKHALDKFDTLLEKVAKDPAMLVWLDGVTNVADAPNENFARELMELFTMGITDSVTGQRNYTERDVQEIARAFTGWNFSSPDDEGSNPFDYRFEFNEDEHDFRLKTVFGQTANYDGEDIIQIIAARRETARFLVKKLFEFFVYPLTDSSADRATIDKFADVYMRRDHSIRDLVRAIFTSDEFFSTRARFALIKQPLELVIGAARLLEARFTPGTYDNHEPAHILWYAAADLGQDIFNPPDVSGWNLNLGWINTAVMLNRFNYAAFLASSRPEHDDEPGLYLSLERLKKSVKKDAKKTVKKFLTLLGPLNIDSATRNSLIAYLETDSDGRRVGFDKSDEAIDRKVRGLVHLIMCLAEFQVN
jgi:uncharacterized protein (DUF1800 family)